MSTDSSTEQTNTHEHHLRDLIDPSTDTIIMVPGLDGTAELFYRQTPLLAQSFNVVSFPLPNKRRATMDELVDDLAALVTEVSPKPVVLVGESFGGALSMSFALRQPNLVQGLVIVNSFPYLDNRIQLALAPRITRLIPWVAMPTIRRVTEHRLHSPHTLDEDLLEFRTRMRGIERDGYLRRLEILSHYDIRQSLSEISVPVLLVAGTADRLVPSARWGTFMRQRLPNAELVLLEDYGHCCLINHDLDLHELVEDWWRRHS